MKKNTSLFAKVKEAVSEEKEVSGPSWLKIDKKN